MRNQTVGERKKEKCFVFSLLYLWHGPQGWVGYPLLTHVHFFFKYILSLSAGARVCFSSIPPPLPDLTTSGPEAKKTSLLFFFFNSLVVFSIARVVYVERNRVCYMRACFPRFSASLSLRLAVVILMNCQHHLAVKHITQREIRFYLVIGFRRKKKWQSKRRNRREKNRNTWKNFKEKTKPVAV